MKKILLIIIGVALIFCLAAPASAWWGSKPEPCPECPEIVPCPDPALCPDFEELLDQQSGYWLHFTAPDPDYIWLGGQEKFEKGSDSSHDSGPDQSSDPDNGDNNDGGHGNGHHGGHGHGHGGHGDH